jgi:hypothetical protein
MDQWLIKYAAIVFATIAGMLGYQYIGWSDMKAGDWGSWAQAVGTVLAIFCAIYTSNHQIRSAEMSQRKQEFNVGKRKFLNVLMVISQATFLISEAYEFRSEEQTSMPDDQKYRDLELLRLRGMNKTLEALSLHDVGNLDAVNSLLAMLRVYGEQIYIIERLEGAIACGENRFKDEFERPYVNARSIHENLTTAYNEFLNRHDSPHYHSI